MPEPIARVLEPLVAVATMLALTGVAVVPFLTPAWLSFAQERAEATAWTGWSAAEVRAATDAIVRDLVFGPPVFAVAVRGEPALTERERAHMRDVRGVFGAFAVVVGIAALILIAARRALPADRARAAARTGATALVGLVLVAGALSVVAFDQAFEVFHRLFFSAGSYTFDPRTDRIVQLFPGRLWLETTIALGIVIAVLGLGTRRLLAPRSAP